jgi:hypothetical protein
VSPSPEAAVPPAMAKSALTRDTSPAVAIGDKTALADGMSAFAFDLWYYDVNPPGTPTKITLCPQSCDPLKTSGGSLKVIIGCATTPTT